MPEKNESFIAARSILEWAKSPIYHGGCPYCMPHVIEAERLVAKHENRQVESFATDYQTKDAKQ